MTLLEGFESFTGGLPDTLSWVDAGVSSTITQSSSHVTEGAFSCRLQATGPIGNILMAAQGVNLTGVTTILIDVFIADVPTGCAFFLGAYDGVDQVFETTTLSTTGAFLDFSLDISSFADKSNLEIDLASFNSEVGNYDFYVDNLRTQSAASLSAETINYSLTLSPVSFSSSNSLGVLPTSYALTLGNVFFNVTSLPVQATSYALTLGNVQFTVGDSTTLLGGRAYDSQYNIRKKRLEELDRILEEIEAKAPEKATKELKKPDREYLRDLGLIKNSEINIKALLAEIASIRDFLMQQQLNAQLAALERDDEDALLLMLH